ncbi:MAG TPA: hypothetical protein VFT12_10840 [Thermoanaerobaculia bacterium]|nr:hypothetical protein [Thermoanaerobaculia bacterium]
MAAKKSSKSSKKSSSKKSSSKKSGSSKKRGSGKRELIDTGNDKRYVRRDAKGQFEEVDNVGRSLAADRRQKAKTKAKRGQGDRGDRKTR